MATSYNMIDLFSGAGLSQSSALDRIKVYLQQHVGLPIDGGEIEIVSGISECAGCIRQLRVEQGFRIITGASKDDFTGVNLKPDQYMLLTSEPDLDSARRWIIANRIRRMKKGSKCKILKFLKENIGKIVTTEELSYVSGNKKEFGRRTRELRTQNGYAIATKTTGRPDLGVGEYMLLSIDRVAQEHDRGIDAETQRIVYARDKNTCRNPTCGWHIEKWTERDPRILELHHMVAHKDRGANTVENLVVLCNRCHDELHAKRLDPKLLVK